MRRGISVVVCTYNGAALIPETIRHIAEQRVRAGVEWELLVVDNASTDETAQVAREEWERHRVSTPFAILHQPKQGLSYARELALEMAAYEFVLFCDDDNWLSPDYVDLAFELMQRTPAIGVLGGCGELVFEEGAPLWATRHGSFAHGPQAEKSGRVRTNIVYGAGFVMRKSAYEYISAAGFKPMLTDRSGQNLSAGGDWELCFAIALAGYDIWYDKRLTFRHYISKERVSWDYCVRFFEEGASSLEVLVPYRICANMGCRTMFTFHLGFLRAFISQTKKLFPLLIQRLQTTTNPEEARLLSLRLIAMRARLKSFRRYTAMRQNFARILQLQKNSQQSRPLSEDRALTSEQRKLKSDVAAL